jgi:hypothetical protein
VSSTTGGSGAAIRGTGGVTLTADNMTLNGTVNAGTAILTAQPYEASTLVRAGGADGAATLGLSTTELGNMTAGTLRLGRTSASGIVIEAALSNPAGASTLTLISGGTITQSIGATITVSNLAVNSANTVTLTQANNAATLAAVLSGGGFTYTDANVLMIGTADGIAGITTANGTVDVSTNSGSLYLYGSVDTGNAAIKLGGAVSLRDDGDQTTVLRTTGIIQLTAIAGSIGQSFWQGNWNTNNGYIDVQAGFSSLVTNSATGVFVSQIGAAVLNTNTLSFTVTGPGGGRVGVANLGGNLVLNGTVFNTSHVWVYLWSSGSILDDDNGNAASTYLLASERLILNAGPGGTVGSGSADVDVKTGSVTAQVYINGVAGTPGVNTFITIVP